MKTIFYNTLTNEASTPKFWNTASGYYEVNGKRPQLPDNTTELEVIDTPQPEITNTQYLTSEYQVIGSTYTRVWTIHEKTAEQIAAEQEAEMAAKAEAGKIDAIVFAARKTLNIDTLDPVEVEKVKYLYDRWKDMTDMKKDDIVRYNNELWRVDQEHQREAHWLPGEAHSLYTRIRKEGITEWKQPVSGLDEPYMMGDKVTYLGDTWENQQDNNYYAPDVWGWKKL